MMSWDVIIIGGGIIGLSLAIGLRKRGARVLIVERGEPGREASHAAGGMLVDCPLETLPALQELASASARMYPEFAHELEIESGMKVDLRDFGTILFPSAEHLSHPQFSNFHKARAGLSPDDLAHQEPALQKFAFRDENNTQELEEFRKEWALGCGVGEIREFFRSTVRPALLLEERSVDPRALTAAALKTAKNRGVDFSSGDAVTKVNVEHGRTLGVSTIKTAFAANKVVNCAGAWSGEIAPLPIPTRPVKGQMLCLVMPQRDLLKHVIRSPKAYLIPRSDGRLLVGATVEEAGFDKRTDPSTMKNFQKAAVELVPQLANAKILEDWAGLRPGTPDRLPILGATATPGYYVATGHFRDGILLAPITAKVVAEVIEGREPEHDLSAFSPQRFS